MRVIMLLALILLLSGCLTNQTEINEITSEEEAVSAEHEISMEILSASQNLTSTAANI